MNLMICLTKAIFVKNATYLSSEIQNILLHTVGNMLRQLVCDGVQQATFFSLLADESKDASKKNSWRL